MSGIVGGGAVGSKVVLGETFLRSYYSVYRQDALRGRGAPAAFVSLAPAAPSMTAAAGLEPRAPLARDAHGETLSAPAAAAGGGGGGGGGGLNPNSDPDPDAAPAWTWPPAPGAAAAANQATPQLGGSDSGTSVLPASVGPAATAAPLPRGAQVAAAASYIAAHGTSLSSLPESGSVPDELAPLPAAAQAEAQGAGAQTLPAPQPPTPRAGR